MPPKEYIVMRKVLEGERPGIPGGTDGVWFTDDLWGMVNRCWTTQPENRPSVEAILDCLEGVSGTWRSPSRVDERNDDWSLAEVRPSALALPSRALRTDHGSDLPAEFRRTRVDLSSRYSTRARHAPDLQCLERGGVLEQEFGRTHVVQDHFAAVLAQRSTFHFRRLNHHGSRVRSRYEFFYTFSASRLLFFAVSFLLDFLYSFLFGVFVVEGAGAFRKGNLTV